MALGLVIRNLNKSYSSRQILCGCSYDFMENAVYSLMGSNGAGKSTFLRICSLLENPDGGEVVYTNDGEVLRKDLRLRRRLTLVLPDIGLFNCSVAGNVGYGLRLRGVARKATELRVREILEYVGLDKKFDQNALSLSSGEKQRLGIARALAIGPEILFLDEPTASVDTENTMIIERIILDLKKRCSAKIIMTTHDKAQAERLADFKLFLENGDLSLV